MAQMQSGKPALKVSVGAAVGAAVTIVIFIVEKAAKTTIPAYIAVAASTLLTFVISYLIPPSDSDQITN
jgi:hypothetical protein